MLNISPKKAGSGRPQTSNYVGRKWPASNISLWPIRHSYIFISGPQTLHSPIRGLHWRTFWLQLTSFVRAVFHRSSSNCDPTYRANSETPRIR